MIKISPQLRLTSDSLRGFSEPGWRPSETKTHTAVPAVMFTAWNVRNRSHTIIYGLWLSSHERFPYPFSIFVCCFCNECYCMRDLPVKYLGISWILFHVLLFDVPINFCYLTCRFGAQLLQRSCVPRLVWDVECKVNAHEKTKQIAFVRSII